MAVDHKIHWRFPDAFQPLLKPARRKGIWGGRGSGKSTWAAAYCVIELLKGRSVLCVREIQKSMADSSIAALCSASVKSRSPWPTVPRS